MTRRKLSPWLPVHVRTDARGKVQIGFHSASLSDKLIKALRKAKASGIPKPIGKRKGAVRVSPTGRMFKQERNPGSSAIPGIAKWNMYAGGTSAAPGKHSYDLRVSPGNLAGGRRQYVVSPISYSNGRHRGYLLQVAGSPEYSGLWKDLGMHRSPQQAASAARRHYGG